jgi:sodium-coupled neutral amino acid transporter 11
MPLLVGLLDSTHIQRSQDGSMLLASSGQSEEEVDEELEGLVAKRKNGGGMLDSIANMANSILGAGECRFRPLSAHSPNL